MIDPIVLVIAKRAILANFDPQYRLNAEAVVEAYPFLGSMGACFVTLRKDQALRGCIGSIIAHRRLIDDLIANAKSAAFSDPRFDPISPTEFEDDLVLEVSILSEPQQLSYSDYDDLLQKIRPKRDGVILQYGSYQGTFLPQVWDELPDVALFLEHLSYKAGANPGIYEQHPDIYTYEVEHIEAPWNSIDHLSLAKGIQ